MKRKFNFFLAMMVAAVIVLGGCTEPNLKGSTAPQVQIENRSGIEDVQEEEKSDEILENLFTTVYPHDWQNAYAEYLKDINFSPVNLYSIYIKDINSDDIPEIIIIHSYSNSNCEILSFVDGSLEVMNLHDVEKIYYKEDTFQLIIYSADGFSSGKRDYYQVYDLIENNYEITLNFGVKVVADPDSYNDGEYDLYYTYTINDDYINGENQPENEIDEHQFNKLLLEIESLISDAELLKLTYEDLSGGFAAYIEEMLFN